MPSDLIIERINQTFAKFPRKHSRVRIVRDFLTALAQNAAMTPGEQVSEDDAVALTAIDIPLTE